MLSRFRTLIFLPVALAVAAPLLAQPRDPNRMPRPEREPNIGTLFQVSTLDALLQGVYQGAMRIEDLRKYGDFGVGTLDGLDGEMIILDGDFYQVTSDGIVHRPSEQATVPFAAITRFRSESQILVDRPTTMAELATLLDGTFPSANYFYAIKVHGTFRSVLARSVPRQVPPYPPLGNVIAMQSVFPLGDIDGTAVCLKTPDFAAGINVAGYHCHFISDDGTHGGHALDFQIGSASVDWSTMRQHQTFLPEGDAFRDVPLPMAP